jgi:mono/diheme cytochrome c family protein
MKVVQGIVFVALVMGLATGSMFAADDGAALYKSKCAACHGPNGEGKMGPKLAGDAMSEAQIVDQLTKGTAGKKPPHAKPISGLTEDQAKAVASYIKSLK